MKTFINYRNYFDVNCDREQGLVYESTHHLRNVCKSTKVVSVVNSIRWYRTVSGKVSSLIHPGWSPRANQRWTALFQRFHKFQRWSALFQNGLRKSALISAVSEPFSAGFLWISAVQRWIKTKWETDKNALYKFEKVLGSRKTCSFGVYQLWKNHSGEILVKNSNWRTRLFLMLLGRKWPVE